MTGALAAEAPWWEPGTRSGYHAMTYGYLVGEVVRRAGGRTLGALFREELAGPLGADFHIGLPASEDARVAELVPPSPEEVAAAGPTAVVDPESLLGKVMGNPPLQPGLANTLPWRRAEIPAANGHGNARSVARVMAALAGGGALDGVRLLREATLARAIAEQCSGPDLVLPHPDALGPRLHAHPAPASPRPEPARLRSRGLGRLPRHRRSGRAGSPGPT